MTALDRVSFDVTPGSIVGVIGPNGAGKTSLFNCITRLYRPSSGTITVNGTDLLAARPHDVIRLGIARTFQNVALFARMTVLENVLVGDHSQVRAGMVAAALMLPAVRTAEKEAVGRAMAALQVVGLDQVAQRPVAGLPFGTQKRIELARALVSRPKLLLLDEPAGGLSHDELGELSALIRLVHRDYEVTILLVEHHMNLVMTLSDRVVVLSFGRKISEGTPDEVRNDQAVIDAYLGTAGAA